ncbi:hypothetical protein ACHAXS_012469 [Conticribra weissflogii]
MANSELLSAEPTPAPISPMMTEFSSKRRRSNAGVVGTGTIALVIGMISWRIGNILKSSHRAESQSSSGLFDGLRISLFTFMGLRASLSEHTIFSIGTIFLI